MTNLYYLEVKNMINITPVLGCDYLRDNGHIDETAGIFGVLVEKFRQLKSGNIIPVCNNTQCAGRATKQCNVNCENAVSGWLVGGKISWRKYWKRM